jgi:hypothetical protein
VATVLNRTTKQFISSANTVEHPVQDWIIEPDMSAVVGFPSLYWVITGDNVTLMNEGERAAVDAALLTDQRDDTANRMDNIEDVIRALALTILDELNLHATRQVQLLNAIDNNTTLANIRTAVAGISDIPQRTGAQLKTTVRNKLGT